MYFKHKKNFKKLLTPLTVHTHTNNNVMYMCTDNIVISITIVDYILQTILANKFQC